MIVYRFLSRVQEYQFDGEFLIDAVARMTQFTCLQIIDAGTSLDLTSLAHALLDRPVSRPCPLVTLHCPDHDTCHESLIAQLAEHNVEFQVERLW